MKKTTSEEQRIKSVPGVSSLHDWLEEAVCDWITYEQKATEAEEKEGDTYPEVAHNAELAAQARTRAAVYQVGLSILRELDEVKAQLRESGGVVDE